MKYAFAREYLDQKEAKLFRGGEQILLPIYSTEDLTVEYPGYWVKGEAELERNIISIGGMSALNDLGYGVVSVKPSKRFRKKQKVQYMLAKLEQFDRYLRAMPQDTYVKYDVANKQLKLVGPNTGPNGEGNWVKMVIKYKERKVKYETIFDKIRHKEKIQQDFKHELFRTDKKEYVEIRDLPFMISNANEIICIDSELTDEPRIGIFGGSGTGKSTAKHTLMDRAFWYWKIRPVILHDGQKETSEYGVPNISEAMILENLNEKPRPLPTVYLHPNTETAEKPIHQDKGVGFRMTLPYDEVIINSHIYLEELKKSAKFFNHKKPEFLGIEEPVTLDKIKEVFRSGDEKYDINKPPHASITKFMNLWKQLESEKVVDVFTGIPSKWVLEMHGRAKEYNPITACMLAGAVPIMVTEDLFQREYFPKVFQYYASDIFNRYDSPEFKEVRVWLDIDELHDITRKGKINTPAAESIISIQRKGRQRGIGTIVATQFYDKCPTEIVANCDHLIVFKTIESTEIRSDYSGISKLHAKEIQQLGVFECMAYTDKQFVVYDLDGKIRKERGPFFGRILPPLSTHLPPEGKKRRLR